MHRLTIGGHLVSTAGHRVGMVLEAVKAGPIRAALVLGGAIGGAGAGAIRGAGAGVASAISSVLE